MHQTNNHPSKVVRKKHKPIVLVLVIVNIIRSRDA